MDKIWDITIEYLAKVNQWIPLVVVLLAGLGIVCLTLFLAIVGCAVRKRLVPHWLIWTYFTFALIVIVAHIGNNLAGIVEAMEIPVIVVLLCYIITIFFYRRPRYVYVEKEVYARELAKGRVAVVKPNKKEDKKAVREMRQNEQEKVQSEKTVMEVSNVEVEEEHKADEQTAEELNDFEQAELEAEEVRRAAAEQAAIEAREMEEAAQEAELAARAAEKEAEEKIARETMATTTKRIDKDDFYTPRTVARSTTTNTYSTIDLPTVNPIPDKAYEPTREPTIMATPVSKTMPDLKMPKSTVQLRSNSYSSSTDRVASRPTTTVTTSQVTPNRTVRTETTTATGNNAYTSMYNPRIIRTTTTTTNTNTDRLEAVTNSRTVNGNTTSSTSVKLTTNGQTPRSTEDVMAAIERLRASMKK